MSEQTEPLYMPLEGLRLVEASAGTGKTFTLAGLYLRLLIEQRLPVREILVMTFTRAATQELRERIRSRLARAAQIAADPRRADDGPEDRITLAFIERSDEDPAALARRLADAAARMDEATITTIHGFSQMAVAENAFESGVAFDRGEQTEDAPLLEEAVRDYWRRQVIGGDKPELAQLWSSPGACLADIRPVLQKPGVRLAGPAPQQAAQLMTDARAAWQKQRDALLATLTTVARTGEFKANGKLIKAVPDAAAMDALFQDVDTVLAHGFGLPATLELLSTDKLPSQLKGAAKKAGVPAAQTAAVDKLLEAGVVWRIDCIREATAAVSEQLERIKRERRLFSFDDMIQALHRAITDPQQGPALAAALKRRWPWALVDEFQDTDPAQYAILRAIHAASGRGGLIMIGDPKQAIYAFRGGDVFAYLQASADAAGRYSLARNYRSSAGVLGAIESVFSPPDGRPFVIDAINFQPVSPGRKENDWWIETGGGPLAPMTLWTLAGEDDGTPLSAGKATPLLQRQCLAEISRLLAQGQINKGGEPRPLAAGDICVLVNTNAQATAMQTLLSRHGIAAACLHQSPVFASEQAVDMLRLLRAAATPADARRVKAALTGELFAWRLGELIELARDEAQWQACYDRFQQAHQRWAQSGVLAMLEPLIQAAGARLLGRLDGERRVTNWLHLAELLQAAESETFGMNGLIRWLGEQIEDTGNRRGDPDNTAQLRLESDENLVRITTIYKAKGLQYPVVMLPFAPLLGTVGTHNNRPGVPPFQFHDEHYQAWLEAGSPDAAQHAGQSIREHKAEALRLLYVGLTRAEQALYVASGHINGAGNGALAWLLLQDAGCPDDVWATGKDDVGAFFTAQTLAAAHQRLAQQAGACIQSVAVGDTPPATAPPASPAAPGGEARTDFPEPRRNWRRVSFSALVRDDRHGTGTRRGADDETEIPEPLAAAESGGEPCDPALERLGGPAFGSAVHDVLESADFRTWPAPGAALGEARTGSIEAALRRYGVGLEGDARRQRTVAAIGRLVAHTLHTPLPVLGPLSAVDPDAQLAEMPFTLRLGGQSAARVIACLRDHGYDSALSASHRGQTLRGLMQGFIDLIVEHEGRYWVLDYKTNRLGDHYNDYTPAHLQRAVAAGHYDLQYLIYLTALHRHLRCSLADYHPDTHLGGVQYLFLRGMNGRDSTTGVFEERPDSALIMALDALFDGREVSDGVA